MKEGVKTAVSVAVFVAVMFIGYSILGIIPIGGGGNSQTVCLYCNDTGEIEHIGTGGSTFTKECFHPPSTGFTCDYCRDTGWTAVDSTTTVKSCPNHNEPPGKYLCDYCHDCGYIAFRVISIITEYHPELGGWVPISRERYVSLKCPWCS